MSNFTSFEIVVGTYEEYLLGYIFSSEEQTLVHSFASHDHSSSVRCLATYGNYLASGSSDDRIIIYDLKARKEHCMLTHHESTISAVAFTNNHSHVVSASQDGTLAIVRVGNWQLEKVWEKAHKAGYVVDIALHSSGKLALTLGTDATIRTWNLVKGRAAYIINLNTKCKDPKSLEHIIFAPDDTRFLLYGGKYTEIWSIEIGGAVKVIEHDQKVTCCTWLDNNTLFVGYEDGQLGVVNLENDKRKIKNGHNGRVKAVQCFEDFIVTGSSSGQIKVWTKKLREIVSMESGCRITCLCISQLVGKWKKEESEEEPNEKEVISKKTMKRSVVVEIEESSEEEKIITKNPKKQKRGENDQLISLEGNEKTRKNKQKKKDKVSVTSASKDDYSVEHNKDAGVVKGLDKKNTDLNKKLKKNKRKKKMHKVEQNF